MKCFGIVATCMLLAAPVTSQAQDATSNDLDAYALYALTSVAGVRPNCSSLVAGSEGIAGANPEERWLTWDDSSDQWRLMRSSMEPGTDEGIAISSNENAIALFVVCGVAPWSDQDLTLLTDGIQQAAKVMGGGAPGLPGN